MLKKGILLLFFSLCIISYAQEPIRYTTKQGLPSNHIYDIQEDANGFMWFATNRGLVKYDGENFRTFTIKDGLPNNDTWLLDLDYKGKLWYFSKSSYQGYIKNDSIYKFPVVNNTVITPRFISKSKEKLFIQSDVGIQSVINDTVKGVGIFSDENFKKYQEKIDAAIHKTFFYSKNRASIANASASEYAVIIKDKLYFLDKSFQLIKQSKINALKNYSKHPIKNQGSFYNKISLHALDKGVLFIDFKTKTTKYFSFKKLINVASVKYFRSKGLKNEIQISIPGHLLVFDYKLNFKTSYSFPEKLSRISYRDSKGNIWLGDFTNGISLIPNTQLKAKYYLQNKKVQKINNIDGVFYAGINDDAFYTLDKITHKFEKSASLFKQNGEIYQIEKNENHKTYLISSGGSFFKKNNSYNNIFFRKLSDKGISTNAEFKNITFFDDHFYIISGNHILKGTKDYVYLKDYVQKTGLLTSAIFKNNLFYGCADGLHIIKKDRLERTILKNNLLNISILSFLSTKENLFVGTDGRGVYMYNTEQVIHLKNTDGFSIQKIIKKDNKLWVATNKGVHQISLNKNNFSNSKITNSFYESDGLLQNNINDIVIDNNHLFAASDIGISKINVQDSIYKQQPKLYFKTKKDTISFAREERDNISITYALQDYTNQSYVNYQYRLLPLQKKWTTTQTKILNFSNLSPKLYQLEVKATDQHFNETFATQYINVLPRWWQTTFAKIGFGLFSVLCFLGFVKLMKKQIQKKEESKAQLDKKIAGLELQALRSQMNPHFVHNSLNAIQYFIQRNEVELSEDYLVKFSKLVRTFFEYSRRQNISIQDEANLLENYLQIEKLRFEEKLNFEIKIDQEIDAEEQVIPSMILQPIVENAVNHGLFHKPDKGKICVFFKYIDEITFEVIVIDDGIGINKAKEIYKSSTKNYQSHSTSVLKERLELLQQSKEWMINYTIIDLNEKDKSKTGTEVKIVFKNSML